MTKSKAKSKVYLLAVCVTLLSACASNVRLDDLPPVSASRASVDLGTQSRGGNNNNNSNTNANTNGSQAANSAGVGGVRTATGAAIATVQAGSTDSNQPTAAALAKRSVYFDYDSFSIREESRIVLQAHAKHLSSNRSLKIALEGHTDERGGSEYNLALGQKRANAVQEVLQLLGVTAAQMEAVSFGKEKPKAQGSDEAGYAENRRADIQYR